uniref:Uncharacterized protein n=1 Tax=Oryza punctata TaxID=4537 RepID=A0A0E0LQF9_ORYPU
MTFGWFVDTEGGNLQTLLPGIVVGLCKLWVLITQVVIFMLLYILLAAFLSVSICSSFDPLSIRLNGGCVLIWPNCTAENGRSCGQPQSGFFQDRKCSFHLLFVMCTWDNI